MNSVDPREVVYARVRKCGHVVFLIPVISLCIALATRGCKINVIKVYDFLALAFAWLIVLPLQKISEGTAPPDTIQEEIAWFGGFLRVYIVPYVLMYFFVRLGFGSWQPRLGAQTLCDILSQWGH